MGMIRKQRLRTTGRHFERANKGETGERKKVKRGGEGVSSPQFLPCSRVQNGGRSFVIAVFESFPPQNRLLCRLFVMLYKVVLTFESVDEILKWSCLLSCTTWL